MKLKKLLCLALAAIVMATCFVGCGSSKSGDSSKKSDSKTVFKPDGESKGTLKIGFDAEYPPYGYLDTKTNQYVGFDIDLAKAACKSINYTLELVPVDWDYKDAELDSGTIDCIWSGFTMNSMDDDGVNRSEKYTWSGSYSDNSIVILVKGDSIKKLDDLSGKIVKVQAGSSGESALKENKELVASFNGGNYETCKDYTNAFTELESGAVDALAIDIGVAKKLIDGKDGYTILDEEISSEKYGIGFKKGNTKLRDTIWNAILSLDEKTIDDLAKKYDLVGSINIDRG